MTISVIVPVYNTSLYLKKCLSSILKQTYSDFEIIVVNDGSTDDSQKIIDKIKKKYPKKIKAFIKKNGGLSSARNYGIKKASGDYIAFVDSDDWIEKEYLEKLYNTAIRGDYDITVCDTIKDYPDCREVLRSNLEYSNDNIKNYIISYPMVWIRLFKRELFENNYLFIENILYEDLCLSPTFVNKTKKIGFVNLPLYHYVQRDNSIMHQKKFSNNLYDIIKVLEIVYNSFKDNNNLEEYRDEIEYLYITHLLRSTTLRFLQYNDGQNKLKKVNNIIKIKFPNWRRNPYFKKSSFKMQLICRLAYNEKYRFIKLLQKIKKN